MPKHSKKIFVLYIVRNSSHIGSKHANYPPSSNNRNSAQVNTISLLIRFSITTVITVILCLKIVINVFKRLRCLLKRFRRYGYWRHVCMGYGLRVSLGVKEDYKIIIMRDKV